MSDFEGAEVKCDCGKVITCFVKLKRPQKFLCKECLEGENEKRK